MKKSNKLCDDLTTEYIADSVLYRICVYMNPNFIVCQKIATEYIKFNHK